MKTSWVWPTSSTAAALQPGKTYSIGGNLNNVNGFAEFNVSFTYSSSCSATSYNSAGPTGNQGWRYVFSQVDTTHELPATPSTGISVFTGPTVFGTSRFPKISLYLDYVDVCNCIFVNWIGYTTTDTPGTYKTHYWNSQTDKRSQNSTMSKRQCMSGCGGLTTCGPCGGMHTYACNQGGTSCPPLPEGNTNLGSNPWNNGGVTVSKRTTYYLYWINVNQTACAGTPSIGSYGNGPSGSVATFASLGVTYI